MPNAAVPPRHAFELFRAYVPRWAHAPLSGAGASLFGGRWNPVGAPTIYAALELSTAWSEYNQGLTQHPALLALLRLSNAAIADLTDEAVLERFGVSHDIHEEEWRALVDRGEEPTAYAVRRAILAAGYDGVIYPSFMSRGGRCMALWAWNETGPAKLEVIDPERRLPLSPASWL